MPQVGFTCPDGAQIDFADCFEKCRMGTECCSFATRLALSEQREWKEQASCTQLLKGTREAVLELSCPYYRACSWDLFRLYGTKHHALKEETAGELMHNYCVVEEPRELWGITTILDFRQRIGSEKGTGQWRIIDYKFVGAYSVAKMLGFKMVKKEKVEQPPDYGNYQLQLNFHRLTLETQGVPVAEMWIEATVRDGGIQQSFRQGIEDNIYMIPIPRLDDKEVEDYFRAKQSALFRGLDLYNEEPEAFHNEVEWDCTDRETWGGNKCCQKYCNAYTHCQQWRRGKDGKLENWI